MNPQDFWWTEDQSVVVINPNRPISEGNDDPNDPTLGDYNFMVHGKKYMIPPDTTVRLPGFIAWIYVYERGVQAAQLDNVFPRWNEEGFRRKYYERFVKSVDELVQVVSQAEPEVRTFDEVDDPPAGQGVNYEPKRASRAGRR